MKICLLGGCEVLRKSPQAEDSFALLSFPLKLTENTVVRQIPLRCRSLPICGEKALQTQSQLRPVRGSRNPPSADRATGSNRVWHVQVLPVSWSVWGCACWFPAVIRWGFCWGFLTLHSSFCCCRVQEEKAVETSKFCCAPSRRHSCHSAMGTWPRGSLCLLTSWSSQVSPASWSTRSPRFLSSACLQGRLSSTCFLRIPAHLLRCPPSFAHLQRCAKCPGPALLAALYPSPCTAVSSSYLQLLLPVCHLLSEGEPRGGPLWSSPRSSTFNTGSPRIFWPSYSQEVANRLLFWLSLASIHV